MTDSRSKQLRRKRDGQGSFLLGLVAGSLGGLVVLALVWRRGKPQTLKGLYFGLAVNVALFISALR